MKYICYISIAFAIIGIIPAMIVYPNIHGLIQGTIIGALIGIIAFCIGMLMKLWFEE